MFSNFKQQAKVIIGSAIIFGAATAYSASSVEFFNSKENMLAALPKERIAKLVKDNIAIAAYRVVKVQAIYNSKHQLDYFLVYLFSRQYHKVEVEKISVDAGFNVLSLTKNYLLTDWDFDQQPGLQQNAKCPDTKIEFIAFAPNNDVLEQKVTKEVAAAAKAKNLNTISLLKKQATTQNYLNYMKCPQLKGNFYDGDANPTLITTVDGVISTKQFSKVLSGQFKYKVTNIWLACEAFNDPIKTAVKDTDQSQKYAAGINDLEVGPSDQAAACAMEAALNGQPMTAAFKDCYDKLDIPDDKWGFEGEGSDVFGS